MSNLRTILAQATLGSVTFSKKTGVWKIKQSFFYRQGRSSERLAERTKEALIQAGFTVKTLEHEEHWNAWPKNSWFEVRFTV